MSNLKNLTLLLYKFKFERADDGVDSENIKCYLANQIYFFIIIKFSCHFLCRSEYIKLLMIL